MNTHEIKVQNFYKLIENESVKNKDLVEKTGFTRGYISNVVTKKNPPTESFLTKIEEVYNIDLVNNNTFSIIKTSNVEFNSNHFKSVPFYNINVSAGDVVFLDDGMLENKEPDDLMFIPKNIDADIAFPTYGHSMYPEISNGDRVAYKIIKDWSFFNYGMKYLIITDEQRMVKYLKKHSKEGYVLLESRNKDFEPIDMPISSIRAILQVRYIGKIEM